MLCVRPKVMKVNRQKFQSDVPRIQYGIVGEKGGNIFSAFYTVSGAREDAFKNINQKLDCKIAGNPTSDFITKTSLFLVLPP